MYTLPKLDTEISATQEARKNTYKTPTNVQGGMEKNRERRLRNKSV